MNRAILIVICDFIVSAMLSLFTGTAVNNPYGTHGAALDSRTAAVIMQELRKEQSKLEAERKALADAQFKQGYSAAREATLKDMARQLAEVQARSEMLERKLALSKEKTGALTPEQLQKQLEKEIRDRMQLNLRHQDAERELDYLKKQNRMTAEEFAKLRESYAARQAELSETRKTADKTAAELEAERKALTNARATAAVQAAELERTGKAAEEARGQRKQFETALSFTRGRLSATERELAEAQSRAERSQRAIAARELELNEARRRLDNLQSVLKKAVGELSSTRAELLEKRKAAELAARRLAETETAMESAKGELSTTRAKLDAAEDQLRSDVLERYTKSACKVDYKLSEKMLLLPQRLEGSLFLPLVSLGGKNCIIGDFLLLTGNVRNRQNFDRLTELGYVFSPAEGAGVPQSVSGPLYAPRNESRVGLLEVKSIGDRVPLKVITISQLKQRGIQDLYLFKHSAFGKESCSLEGRCSVNFAAGDQYLYIRNSARGSSASELRAEPGDFILTKQGEFVAAVVAIENPDLGRRQEARCVVLPDQFSWADAHVIPLTGKADSGYLSDFARAAQPVLKDILNLENARR